MEHLLLTYTYWAILPLAIIEGPVVTIAASVLASLGYLNIFIVYPLVLLGDIIGDMLHYALGRFGGRQFIKRYGQYVRLDENRIDEIKHTYFDTHASLWRIITVSKITQAPSSLVLLACGITKVNFKQFFFVTTVTNVIKVFVITCIGYFFGQSYLLIAHDLRFIWILLIPVFGGLVYWTYRHKQHSSH
jgi:membrane protein DedA with SNARE-associated domain